MAALLLGVKKLNTFLCIFLLWIHLLVTSIIVALYPTEFIAPSYEKDLNENPFAAFGNTSTRKGDSDREAAFTSWAERVVSELPLGWDTDLEPLIPEPASSTSERPSWNDLLNVSFHAEVEQRINNAVPLNIPFLPNYKSPCWYEAVDDVDGTFSPTPYTTLRSFNVELILKTQNLMKGLLRHRQELDGRAWRLRCMPYFYVVASPRCGTSDLYSLLVKHKHIARTLLKEEIYWNRMRYKNYTGLQTAYKSPLPLQHYLELNDITAEIIRLGRDLHSPGINHKIVFGDVTPSYMYDFDSWRMLPPNRELNKPRYVVADLIHNITPQAKIIFILRNPTERLLSDYNFFQVRRLYRTREGFHKKVTNGIRTIRDCFDNYNVNYCLHDENIGSSMLPIKLRAGIYEPLMKEWFRVFPRAQTYVVKFEEYAADRKNTLRKLFSFLGLDVNGGARLKMFFDKDPSNQSTKRDYHRIPDMYPSTKEKLMDFYRPWNEKLATLLHDDRFLWRNS